MYRTRTVSKLHLCTLYVSQNSVPRQTSTVTKLCSCHWKRGLSLVSVSQSCTCVDIQVLSQNCICVKTRTVGVTKLCTSTICVKTRTCHKAVLVCTRKRRLSQRCTRTATRTIVTQSHNSSCVGLDTKVQSYRSKLVLSEK